MKLRTPREINETLTIMGFSIVSLAAAIITVPMFFMMFDMFGLLLSFGIIAVGGVIQKLPRGYLFHKLYEMGLMRGFYDGVPHGPVKKFYR